MTLHTKVNGTWEEVHVPSVNVNGTWKSVREVHVHHGGNWKEAHVTHQDYYTSHNNPYVVDEMPAFGENGSYTIPTGQGIGYIELFVEGQAGGGGGGTYTPEYWPCSGSDVNTNAAQSTPINIGGYGGLGGTITCIHRVEDGDYVTWTPYGASGSDRGEGGSGYQLGVYKQAGSAGYPTPGAYSAGNGANGFMMTSSIRNSGGYIKSQMNAGGGRAGPGAVISLDSTCTGSGIAYGFRGFNVSGTNGAYAASGQASNSISAGTWAVSTVQGEGSLNRGAGGNVGYTVSNSGNGSAAQDKGKVKIKLYTPKNY
jgi:hypothetical protein